MKKEQIQKLVEKDQRTWNLFIAKYSPIVYNLCYRIFNDEAKSEKEADFILDYIKKSESFFQEYVNGYTFETFVCLKIKEIYLYRIYLTLSEPEKFNEKHQYLSKLFAYFMEPYIHYKIKCQCTYVKDINKKWSYQEFFEYLIKQGNSKKNHNRKEVVRYFEKMVENFLQEHEKKKR